MKCLEEKVLEGKNQSYVSLFVTNAVLFLLCFSLMMIVFG